MNRAILILFLLGFSILGWAQVGINTNTPQQTLDVAGASSEVRVDGLNTTNNATNLGTGSTTRVYADADGDLTLANNGVAGFELLVDSENYLEDVQTPRNRVTQVGTALGYDITAYPADFASAQFTLTKNAIIEVNYSVSWSIYKTLTPSANNRIGDGDARVIQTGVYFREVTDPTDPYDGPAVINDVDGVPINGGPWCIDMNASATTCLETGGILALNGQFYNNKDSDDGAYRDLRNAGSDYVKLGPGTYVALFVCRVYVGDVGGTGAVKLYLGPDDDELQIIAHYYD